MRNLLLILIALLLISTPSFASFQDTYNEAVIKSTLVIEEDYLVCQAPVKSYMTHVFAASRNFYTQQITDMTLVGQPCIAHIVYEDNHPAPIITITPIYDGEGNQIDTQTTETPVQSNKEIIEALPGYLGKGNAVTLTQDYQAIVGSAEPIWVFVQPEYLDAEVKEIKQSETATLGE